MIVYFVIGIYVLAALIALLHPRVALLWFWPLVLCYPVWLLVGRLPLNAGFDDVFLVCLFIGSLIKSGGRLQTVKPVIFVVLFCLIIFLGDVSTIAAGNNLGMEWSLKLWLKNAGLILLLFSMCSTTMEPAHIQKMVYSLLFGAMVAGALVIFYTVKPNAYNPFQAPYWIQGKDWWMVKIMGPFNYHDEAGGVLGFTVLIGYFLIRFDKGVLRKPIIIVITSLSLIGLLLSGSRSGWIFILFPLILSSLLSKQKILGIFLLGLIAIGVFISIAKFEYFSERVEETISQVKGERTEGVTVGRAFIWQKTLSEPKISWLFFGEGFGIMKGAHTHSNYIAMLKNTGLIGIIFWFILYKNILKKAFWLMRYDPNERMSALFTGVFWAYIGYFMFFIPSTPMMWSGVRYTDFFLMALVYLRYKQVESEAKSYVFEEEPYQGELAYDQIYEVC